MIVESPFPISSLDSNINPLLLALFHWKTVALLTTFSELHIPTMGQSSLFLQLQSNLFVC